ncbi:hypothetical protein CHLRE_10g428720v5 [Chlamydomonas reinhardtii]|uniref:phytol kinase n=1 Tax=Chlamydomonas reinhardtii TaxID=3055 RepID=A0A2K3D9P8_CHLRE|nr:uncharacterized protein CHLRE_10g428720v5 [Chlamydomonas reinhardtii]PNW77255.1 hypothetical protein CHLRE_10g428720v5 [Chlamydomonas reinhardtii]
MAMTYLLNILNVVSVGSSREYQEAAVSELATALAQSQVLEHAAAALLRLADHLHTLPAPAAAAAGGDRGGVDGGSGGADSSTSGAGGGSGGSAGRRSHPVHPPGNIAVRSPPDLAATAEELWGLHQHASESLLCVIHGLVAGAYRPWEYLSASVDRHPQLGPIGDFARATGLDPVAMADDFRRVVVGPAVQLFLLACVATAGASPQLLTAEPIQIQIQVQSQQPQPPALQLRWTNRPLQRHKMIGATGKGPSTLAAGLQAAALALQATVMGAGHVLPFAQPPYGHQPGAHPRQRPAHLSPFTSSPVCVFDIVARTCDAVLASVLGDSAATAAGGSSSAGASSNAGGGSGGGGSYSDDGVGRKVHSILHPLRLLVRLLPELRPRQAAARLPGLWRLLAAVLPLLLAVPPQQDLVLDSVSLVNDASLLLRLRLNEFGVVLPPPEWLPRQSPVPVQQPREGTHGDSSADPDAPSKAHAGATAAGGYSDSLWFALDAGLLPALEQLLRTAFAAHAAEERAGAPAAAGAGTVAVAAGAQAAASSAAAAGTAGAAEPVGMSGSRSRAEERVMAAMYIAGSLLLASGVFPAVLTHANMSEVVPLLATLCGVLRQLATPGGDVKLHSVPRLGVAVALRKQDVQASAACYWKLVLGSLIEQVQSVLDAAGEEGTGLATAESQQQQAQQPEQQPAGAPADAQAAATASAATAATARNTVPDGGDEPPTINKWLQPAHVSRAWMLAAAAGGLPVPRSWEWKWLASLSGMFALWALPAICTTAPDAKLAMPIAALDVAMSLLSAQLHAQRSLLVAFMRYNTVATALQAGVDAGGTPASSSSGGGSHRDRKGERRELYTLAHQQEALANLHEWIAYCQSTGTVLLYAECVAHVRRAAMIGDVYNGRRGVHASGGPPEVAVHPAVHGGALSPAAAAAGASRRPAPAVAAAAAAEVCEQHASATTAAAACKGHTGAGAGAGGSSSRGVGGSGAGSSGGSSAMPSLSIGGPVRHLSDGEQQAVARAMLDVLEVEAACLPWMRLGKISHDCPEHRLPFLMMPPDALELLDRGDERPWLKPFLLPGPNDGTWGRLWLKVAAPPRPLTSEEVAAASAAYPELVRQVCARHMPSNCDQSFSTQIPGRLACGFLECDSQQLAGHEADLDEAAQADEGCAGGGANGSAGGSGGAGGSGDGSHRASWGAAAAAAAAAPRICGNPACRNLDGPSALIPPGAGKTCARCRMVTYCCGACQLAHWREGRHGEVCPLLAQLRQLRERSSAAPGEGEAAAEGVAEQASR